MKSISSISIKNKKIYITAIIIFILLITFIITIFNFFSIRTKIKKLQQDLDNKTQLISPLTASPQSKDSEILLKSLNSIIQKTPSSNDPQVQQINKNLEKNIKNLEETIKNNNLDKKIRLIFQKAKEEFEQEDDDDARQLVHLLQKFQICCDELDKIKKKINDDIETKIRSIKDPKNNSIKIDEKLITNLSLAREFLSRYSELIDINILLYPELTEYIQNTNDALEVYYLKQIKLQMPTKSNLLVTLNRKLQQEQPNNVQDNIIKLFNTILLSSNN